MRPTKTRFVTVCQQAMVVGAALALLGPAADVISLDVLRPEASRAAGSAALQTAVETAPVEPEVTDVVLETPAAAGAAADNAREVKDVEAAAATADRPEGGSTLVTPPQDVAGYGAIGVTWADGAEVAERDVVIEARTRLDGTWSDWSEVHYEDSEGPDRGSSEDQSRPGTDPLIIGDVDQVQTRVTAAPGVELRDLEMAVIDPGASTGTTVEAPAIRPASAGTDGEAILATDRGDLALQASTVAPQPTIYSRAQWGANESLRREAPSYGSISAGFVHHTVNANNYTAEQVPGIIRSIYTYHVQTRGWNDIGYNFLIDRFGKIWEGRYGGVDRAVIGAHTSGYNSYSFGASAIGNYEEVAPSAETLDAYARLMAWKLSLHGVAANDTSQQVGSGTFQAVNGHRDAGTTACPGAHLYAKLAQIRSSAKAYQDAAEPPIVVGGPGLLTAASPRRLLDTRSGNGAPAGMVPANGQVVLQVAGRSGIPVSGVGAVVLNVTATDQGAGGYVSVYPSDMARPLVSNLNFGPYQTIANHVTVKLSASGSVTLFNGSTRPLHLVADLAAVYGAGDSTQPGAFVGVTPTRILDSRVGLGAPALAVGARQKVRLKVAGVGGVPSGTTAAAVALNVTVTETSKIGFITAYPGGDSLPLASNLNFAPGQTVPNAVSVKMGSDGYVELFNGSAASVHLIADVAGWFRAGEVSATGALTSVTPARILDTRSSSAVQPGQTLVVPVAGRGGVPTGGTARAAVINVTVTDTRNIGYVTAYPDGGVPHASNINFVAGQTIPNLVTVKVGSDGSIRLYNGSSSTIHLIADVAGWYR